MKKQKTLISEIKIIDDWPDTKQFVCAKADGKTKFDFNKFTFPSKFTLKIYATGSRR